MLFIVAAVNSDQLLRAVTASTTTTSSSSISAGSSNPRKLITLEVDDEFMKAYFVEGSDGRFMCTLCRGHLHVRENLDRCRHLSWHMRGYKRACCPLCDTPIVSVNRLICHIRYRHRATGNFSCEKCEAVYDSVDRFAAHLQSSRVSAFQCGSCLLTYATLREICVHINTSHASGPGVYLEVDHLTCYKRDLTGSPSTDIQSSLSAPGTPHLATSSVASISNSSSLASTPIIGRRESCRNIVQESAPVGDGTTQPVLGIAITTAPASNAATSAAFSTATTVSPVAGKPGNPVKMRYRCKKCTYFASPKQSDVRQHIRVVHGIEDWLIINQLTARISLKNKIPADSNDKGSKSASISVTKKATHCNVGSRQQSQGSLGQFVCTICSFRTNSNVALIMHKKVHNEIRALKLECYYKCRVCCFISIRLRGMKQHYTKSHKELATLAATNILVISNG
jgi:hypothetical protein